MVLTFEEFEKYLPDLPTYERTLVQQAFSYAQKSHIGQKRRSGEDYFVHCFEVARILAELQLDASVIAAGLLHDVVEDTDTNLDDIRDTFGDEIAGLVSGVTKIEQITLSNETRGKGRDREAEFLRKTLLAMNDDVRVVLIKLADRLHNMRTLGHLSQDKQLRIARETMEIFAPLANRLGIWQMKWELQDLSFRYLEPDTYRMIAGLLAERRADRERYIEKVAEQLQAILREHNLEASIEARSKHIYSIWRKMERKALSFDQISDVRAVRVIVEDVAACYQVLGIIHQTWRPIAGEFDDYIAAPKDNFYQSLHTAVFLEDGKTLEVQIRTPEMHTHAEYGIAAHWRYKETNAQHDEAFQRRIKVLRDMIEIGRGVDDASEFIEVLRKEAFEDRVYVFTPRGDIVDLPSGSTPIDFAYHIHTDIGHRCRGAKVNGKLVSLNYVLKVGDRVEVVTSKRGGPSRDWLNPNLGYAKTKRAQSKIRQWFRKQDREKMISLGREILDRELKRFGVEHRMSHDQVALMLGFEKTEDALAQIGFGDIHPQQIATKVVELDRDDEEVWSYQSSSDTSSSSTVSGVYIQGAGGMLTNLAGCCNPVRGDDIIGYITRGRGATIHRRDCANIHNLAHERLIAVEWAYTPGKTLNSKYAVPVIISAYDREGLMRDVASAVAEEHINMKDVNIKTHNHIATFYLTMEVESAAQLSRILTKIEHLPNVMEARRRIV